MGGVYVQHVSRAPAYGDNIKRYMIADSLYFIEGTLDQMKDETNPKKLFESLMREFLSGAKYLTVDGTESGKTMRMNASIFDIGYAFNPDKTSDIFRGGESGMSHILVILVIIILFIIFISISNNKPTYVFWTKNK